MRGSLRRPDRLAQGSLGIGASRSVNTGAGHYHIPSHPPRAPTRAVTVLCPPRAPTRAVAVLCPPPPKSSSGSRTDLNPPRPMTPGHVPLASAEVWLSGHTTRHLALGGGGLAAPPDPPKPLCRPPVSVPPSAAGRGANAFEGSPPPPPCAFTVLVGVGGSLCKGGGDYSMKRKIKICKIMRKICENMRKICENMRKICNKICDHLFLPIAERRHTILHCRVGVPSLFRKSVKAKRPQL